MSQNIGGTKMSIKLFIEPAEKVIVNMVVTFVEAFVPAWATVNFALDKSALIGAGAIGLSAAWNLVGKPYLVQQGWLKG
jgi:hypothetical protein